MRLGTVFLLLISSLPLCAESLWLKPHSDIKNPLGLWVMPISSSQRTSLTIFKDKSFNVYLTYEFVVSDMVPPFTASEYAASVSEGNKLTIKERGKDFLYIEDSKVTRTGEGQQNTSLCRVYDCQSSKKRLIAYCAAKESNGSFELFQVSDNSKIATFKSGSRWEIIMYKNGYHNTYRTAALMLAGLKVFKAMNN